MPSSTTTFALPSQRDLFEDILSRAQDEFPVGGGPRFAPFDTFVGPSSATSRALRGIESLAGRGSSLLDTGARTLEDTISGRFLGADPASQFLTSTARGDFLDPSSNSFIRDVFQRQVAPAIRENVNSSFIGRGRLGSAANTRVLADSLGNAANQLFGENFARERGNQINAASLLDTAFGRERRNQLSATQLAPAFRGAQFGDLERLAGVGATREGFSAAQLQDRLNRFNFEQNRELQNLQALQGLGFGGFVPQRTSIPSQSNRAGNILTGALGGGLLGGSLFQSNPLLGGGIGAIGGGLIGGLF